MGLTIISLSKGFSPIQAPSKRWIEKCKGESNPLLARILKGDVQLPFLNVYLHNIIEQMLKIHPGAHEESTTVVAHGVHLLAVHLPLKQRGYKGYFLPFKKKSHFNTIAVKSDYVFCILNLQDITK